MWLRPPGGWRNDRFNLLASYHKTLQGCSRQCVLTSGYGSLDSTRPENSPLKVSNAAEFWLMEPSLGQPC